MNKNLVMLVMHASNSLVAMVANVEKLMVVTMVLGSDVESYYCCD